MEASLRQCMIRHLEDTFDDDWCTSTARQRPGWFFIDVLEARRNEEVYTENWHVLRILCALDAVHRIDVQGGVCDWALEDLPAHKMVLIYGYDYNDYNGDYNDYLRRTNLKNRLDRRFGVPPAVREPRAGCHHS